jgi:NAD(P)-dependent dehydrogenase (short-subunit alcohol dehydrogenase family)
VLVTGASSGIGRLTAERLAERGYFVWAGARKAEDLADLGTIEHVRPIRLDVTKQEEVDAAVAVITAAGRGLHALVNNAGVGVFGPLIELPESEFLHQLEVNVFGPWRVTKAFAPLLIASGGRVATTGSISGTVCWPMGGAYCMSKHAVEAFTDSLAAELGPLGVQVSVVDPGNFRSDIEQNARERMRQQGRQNQGSRFAAAMDRMLAGSGDRTQYPEPDAVAEAFFHALSDPAPKRRYLVTPNAREAEMTVRAAIARAVELNRDQPCALDRDALVRMVDEEVQKTQ